MNLYKTEYHHLVENDIREAAAWYGEISDKLKNSFLLEIKEGIKIISKNPLLFQKKYKSVRIYFCNRFPFGIHYRFMDNSKTIIFMAVLHTSRNRKILAKRN